MSRVDQWYFTSNDSRVAEGVASAGGFGLEDWSPFTIQRAKISIGNWWYFQGLDRASITM